MSNIKEAFKKAGYKPDKELGKEKDIKQKETKQSRENNLEDNYTQRAENVILKLKKKLGWNYSKFTTSKIRNILTLVSEIYNDVISEHSKSLNREIQERIEYLKVRLIYESGREARTVKPFVEDAGLIQIIDGIGDDREKFLRFARYMEALVAYHRYHGGNEY